MKRLVFLVEGDTELILINQHVIPYLYKQGFTNSMNAQKIITNRKLHTKGGNINYEYLQNDINRVFAQGNVIITTFLDFFRLPNTFPGYTINVNNIVNVEAAIHKEFGNHPYLIPYIQKHEMEALMYCCIDGFEIVVDEAKALKALQEIIDKYFNPEEINSAPNKAPSKRLKAIFNYDKVVDGELILEAVGISNMINKCPRFALWLQKIQDALRK